MEQPQHYGLTGSVEKDGFLSPEQQLELETIQDKTASRLLEVASSRKPGELHPMAAMATGFGKGRIIHKVITSTLQENPNAKILVIAGTKTTLVEQTHSSLSRHQEQDHQAGNTYIEAEKDDELIDDTTEVNLDITGEQSLLYKTGKFGSNVNVEVATIQKIQFEAKRHMLDAAKYDLVIIDEVHNIGTPQRKATVDKFKKAVGFTATAYRHTGSMKNPKDYGFMIIEALPLPEAQEKGFLPPLLGMQIDTKDLIEDIPVTPTGKIDYTNLEKILKNSPDLLPYITDRLSEILITDTGVYKTTIAVNFVDEAIELGTLLRKKGFRIGLAINKPAARKLNSPELPTLDSIERYKLPYDDDKSIDILISPYVAAEGFDAPNTEALVWASPTDSPVRYTQYTGRLARRSPGKAFGVVIDCLYQTTQFNYSYNFAMWMKDDITELNNGLLYLGPENNISKLRDFPSVARLINQNGRQAIIPFQKLSQEALLPIQEGDFPITGRELQKIFVNGANKMNLALEAIDILGEYYPQLVNKRISRAVVTNTVLDANKFIEIMEDLGAEKHNLLPPQKDEVVLSKTHITSLYRDTRIDPIIKASITAIQEYHPEILVQRLVGSQAVLTITDIHKFDEVMTDLGAKPKTELLPIQDGDFVVSVKNIEAMFINGQNIFKTALEAIEIISNSRPELINQRRSGVQTVTTVSDMETFKKVMANLGAKLYQPTSSLQPNETAINKDYLGYTFTGSKSKLINLRNIALDIISEYYPNLYPIRQNGPRYIHAGQDMTKFIEVMTDLGANPRKP